MGVDADIGCGGVAMLGVHGGDSGGGGGVCADGEDGSEVSCSEDARGEDGGDAGEADGFMGGVHVEHEALDERVDGAVGSVGGEGGEVLGGSEAAGEDEGVQFVGLDVGEVADAAARDAGGFMKDAARLWFGLLGEVIDGGGLGDIGGDADGLGASAIECDEDADGFVDFAAVEDAAAAEENANARCHAKPPWCSRPRGRIIVADEVGRQGKGMPMTFGRGGFGLAYTRQVGGKRVRS